MKLAYALIASLLLGSMPLPTIAQEPVPIIQDEPFPLYRYRLPNGLRIWCQPRPESESVMLSLVVGAGSRYETQADNGISHFVEHMLFAGTERWSEAEIKDVIDRRGGRWNGITGWERTTYFAQVAAADFDLALDWLDQVVFHPTFPAEEVDPERQVIFQEGSQSLGWLVERLESLGLGYGLSSGVRSALFPRSSLALDPLGNKAALARIDRESLLDYYRRHYVAGNTLLIVVGNVSPEQALARAGDLLGNLPVAEAVSLPAVPPSPQAGPYHVTVRGPMPRDEVSIMVGARTVGRDHPDYWPLVVLAEILDDQLTEEIRYEQGLVYGLSAYNRTYADAGYFVIYTDSAPGNRETILQAIEAQLAAVERGEVESGVLADAQAALRGRWALSMEDNQSRAGWLADWAAVLAEDEPLPDYATAIDAVTVGDLARVAGTYFVPSRRYVGFHRPILTLSSGLIGLSVVVVLALSFWFWRRRRRRRLV